MPVTPSLPLTDRKVTPGESVSLECSTQDPARASEGGGGCQWTHYEARIDPATSHYVVDNDELRFEVQGPDDTGIYLCTCNNIIKNRYDLVGSSRTSVCVTPD